MPAVDWNTPVTREDLRPDDDGNAHPYADGTGYRVVAFGICSFCDHMRADWGPGGFFPSHTAMRGCESGKRNHCTCDTCF